MNFLGHSGHEMSRSAWSLVVWVLSSSIVSKYKSQCQHGSWGLSPVWAARWIMKGRSKVKLVEHKSHCSFFVSGLMKGTTLGWRSLLPPWMFILWERNADPVLKLIGHAYKNLDKWQNYCLPRSFHRKMNWPGIERAVLQYVFAYVPWVAF